MARVDPQEARRRAKAARAAKAAESKETAGEDPAEEVAPPEVQEEPVTGELVPAVEPVAIEPLADFADRLHRNLVIDEVPEPVEVGNKEGPLDQDERIQLGTCLRALREGFVAEAVAIKALMAVQRLKLWRGTHDTFEEWAQEHVEAGRQWVAKQIDRYVVSEALGLSADGDVLVIDGHARVLAPILRQPGGAERVREVWKRAQEAQPGGRVTAAVLQRVRTEVLDANQSAGGSTRPLRDLRRTLGRLEVNLDPTVVAEELATFPVAQRDLDDSRDALERISRALEGLGAD